MVAGCLTKPLCFQLRGLKHRNCPRKTQHVQTCANVRQLLSRKIWSSCHRPNKTRNHIQHAPPLLMLKFWQKGARHTWVITVCFPPSACTTPHQHHPESRDNVTYFWATGCDSDLHTCHSHFRGNSFSFQVSITFCPREGSISSGRRWDKLLVPILGLVPNAKIT